MIQERISVDNVEILHRRAGRNSGLPLLFVHGGGSNSGLLSWSTVLPSMAANHPVFLPDLPGFGESHELLDDYRCEDLVDFLGKYVARLGLNRYVMVGLSMGGMMSLGLALRRPPGLAGLVLVGTIGLGSPVPVFPISALAARFPDLHRLIIAVALRSNWLLTIGLRYNLYNTTLVDSALMSQVRRCLEGPHAGEAWVRFVSREVSGRRFVTDFRNQLSEIRTPTLVLHGAGDRLVPVDSIRAATRRFPAGQFEIVQNCGHWLPRECPQEFIAALGTFLKRIGKA